MIKTRNRLYPLPPRFWPALGSDASAALQCASDDASNSPPSARAPRNIQTGSLTSSTILDADREVTLLLGTEIDLNVPTIALLRHLHNYGFTRRPRVDNAVCDLSERVRAIGAAAEEVLRFEARRAGSGMCRSHRLRLRSCRTPGLSTSYPMPSSR